MNPKQMLDFIKSRFSPRAFAEKTITESELKEIFEAARWAPSSYNAQPWRFIYARKGSDFYKKILASMGEWNQQWAQSAPILIATLITKNYEHNQSPYFHAMHDLGIAIGQLSLQALSHQIYIHHIGGFDAEKLTNSLNINKKYQVVTLFALGYLGDDSRIPKEIAEITKNRPRQRKPLEEILFCETTPQ
ncbi:MAG TPA: nitroreductase family protein [Salinivirgaceae bacterium]|nr:nitroreductase family protein [Salinivirgaceae bacterium]